MKEKFILRFLVVLLGLLILVSCQDKEVLLAKANETVVADVQDHSPIYFFFKVEKNDTLVDVNRKNIISSTNWLFNIDSRLPLRKVILEVKKLQQKKSSSMHKNETSENYFTYTNTTNKTLAFLPFTHVMYRLEKPDPFLFQFYLDRNDVVRFKDQIFSKNELSNFINNLAIKPKTKIIFSFDKGMTFQKYMEYKLFLRNLVIEKKGISIHPNFEYIY